MRRTSRVYRDLNVKMKIGVFEAFDLVFCLILMAFFNFVFGKFLFGPLVVFGLPCFILISLWIVKKDKPTDFFLHWIKYHITPGFYSAGQRSYCQKLEGRIYG